MDLEQARSIIEKIKDCGIRNKDLSEILGMTEQSICRKLKDKSKLKTRQIHLLEKFYSVDLSEYYNNADTNFKKLEKIIGIVEEFLNEHDLILSPEKKARLIVLLYKLDLKGNVIEKSNIIYLYNYGTWRD